MISYFLRKTYNFIVNQNSVLINNNQIHSSNRLKGVNLKGDIQIGENNILKFIKASGKIKIGSNNTLNGPNLILVSQINKIEIGNFCSIARDVTIQEYNHPTNRMSTYYLGKHIFKQGHKDEFQSKGDIVIGSDVWIGSKSVILSGVKVGHGAIIAAGSIVTKDVPAYGIVGGNPAKVIRHRFEDSIIKELLRLQWWNWSVDKIKAHKSLFSAPIDLGSLKTLDFND